jgi:hypothetical protein
VKPLSLLLCLALLTPVWGQELPDAPQPQRKEVMPSEGTISISGRSDVTGGSPSGQRVGVHNWFYRHPVLTGGIGGGIIAFVVAVTHKNSCPHYINGIGYDGTPPCPTQCYSAGNCEWGPKK